MAEITKAFDDTIAGERVFAVHPPIATNVSPAVAWPKRTRLVAGRALTHLALNVDQVESAGRIATAGQQLAAGVVRGLEVELRLRGTTQVLHVAPGLGLTVRGEDVYLPRAVEVELDAVPVATASDTSLGDLRGTTDPLAVVVVLQPASLLVTSTDARDPCLVDPTDASFENRQVIDATHLLVVPVDLPLPAVTDAQGGTQDNWRNRLAYALFARELESEVLPWQIHGVPLAVIAGTQADGTLFVDVFSVSRDGGQANPRRVLVPGAGTRRLWQARVNQFTEQLQVVAIGSAGLPQHFRFLPPVGALPKASLDVRGDLGEPHLPLPTNGLLPDDFVVEAVPVELESLDDWLEVSAALQPFDVQEPEQIQVLVPIPQQFYDPDALIVEDETPDEFRFYIRVLLARLNHRLGRRDQVRQDEFALTTQLYGEAPVYPTVDPDAVQGEVQRLFSDDKILPAGDVPPPPEEPYTDRLREELIQVAVRMARLAGPFALASLARQVEIEATGASVPPVSPGIGTQEAANRLYSGRWGARGVTDFVQQVSEKLVRAAEAISVSFTRVRSELYRIQTMISGESAANQLATSPVFASVVPRPGLKTEATQLEFLREFLRPPLDEGGAVAPRASATPIEFITNSLEGAGTVSEAVLFGSNVLQRLRSSPVVDAAGSSVRTKRAVLRRLVQIHDDGLVLTGLLLPGFLVDNPQAGGPPRVEANVDIEAVRGFLQRFDDTGQWEHDTLAEDPNDPNTAQLSDEATAFASATRTIEHTVAALRLVEGQLAGYENALSALKHRLNTDLATLERIRLRLRELGVEITELRDDVRVARALEREEIQRAMRVNRQRRELIEQHVPFLVFRRPRTIDGLMATPTRALVPSRRRSPIPVPACVSSTFEAPPQLRAFVDLLRDAPLRWSRNGALYLTYINRIEALRRVVAMAIYRASNAEPAGFEPFDDSIFQGDAGRRARRLYTEQAAAVRALRVPRVRFAYAYYLRYSWRSLVSQSVDVATFNDVILTGHGRTELSQALTLWLTRIYRVAACLFNKTKLVPPFIRLQWVEAIASSVQPALTDLSILPAWSEVDRDVRQDLQAMAAWLYEQVSPQDAAASAFMSDLLWFCLLLASYPPVNDDVLATPEQVRAVRSGDTLTLSVDATRVRAGLQVLLFESDAAQTSVGGGVIEDLAEGIATVRITSTENDRVILPVKARATELGNVALVPPDEDELELRFALEDA